MVFASSQLPTVDLFQRLNTNLMGAILAGLGRYSEAESLLVESASALKKGKLALRVRQIVYQRFIRLYQSWHAAEPGQGYDAKAAEWRAKLAEFEASREPADAAEEQP